MYLCRTLFYPDIILWQDIWSRSFLHHVEKLVLLLESLLLWSRIINNVIKSIVLLQKRVLSKNDLYIHTQHMHTVLYYIHIDYFFLNSKWTFIFIIFYVVVCTNVGNDFFFGAISTFAYVNSDQVQYFKTLKVVMSWFH